MKKLLERLFTKQELEEQEQAAELSVQPPEGYKFAVTDEVIDDVAKALGIDFEKFSREELKAGLEVEQEHWDVTKGNPVITGRIALAHMKELPDYYVRLEKMEREGRAE